MITWQPPYLLLPFALSLLHSSPGVSWDHLLNTLFVLTSLSRGLLLGKAKPKHPSNLMYSFCGCLRFYSEPGSDVGGSEPPVVNGTHTIHVLLGLRGGSGYTEKQISL